jgi:hypothetical protein
MVKRADKRTKKKAGLTVEQPLRLRLKELLFKIKRVEQACSTLLRSRVPLAPCIHPKLLLLHPTESNK